MLVFSSDYPHVEGRHHVKKLYDGHLPVDETLRAGFYGDTMAAVRGP
jgi:hypothetical protein